MNKYTLFTLPHCPRCVVLKQQLEAAEINYSINEDPSAAEEYADQMWPFLLDENGDMIDFLSALKLCEEARK